MPDEKIEVERGLSENLERALAVVKRRRWWIILPICVTTAVTLVGLSRIPSRYTSEATLLVMQQQVPQRYVLPTSETDIREALQATTEEVLSRSRLLAIIDEFHLYAKERKNRSPEKLLEMMRTDISIQPIETPNSQKDVNSFKISYVASDAQLARDVTSNLTSLFIAQNVETREHQATTTTNFLREQLEAVKARLADAEDAVRNFKMAHLGELPEQQDGNVAILNGLQTQLQNTANALSRAQEQKQYLESLAGYRSLSMEGELSRLESDRAALLERYTPEYPGVVKLTKKIDQMQASLKAMRSPQAPAAGGDKPDFTIGGQLSGLPEIDIGQLRSQMAANRVEIENLTKDEQQLRASIAQYRVRLNQTPVREQQLAGILRNYDLMKQDYADLLNKVMQSQLSGELEKRQEGQQFRLVDRPSLPTVPTSPNRIKISIEGALAGLGLGIALAFVLEMLDGSFHSEEDVNQAFTVPLVIAVPLLLSPAEERGRSRRRAFEWVIGSALALGLFTAELYEYILYRHG